MLKCTSIPSDIDLIHNRRPQPSFDGIWSSARGPRHPPPSQRWLKMRFLEEKDPSHLWPQKLSCFLDWKGFFNAVNLRPTATSSIRLVTAQQRQRKTISLLLLEKRTLLTSDHNITVSPELIFKNYMRSGKDFSMPLI